MNNVKNVDIQSSQTYRSEPADVSKELVGYVFSQKECQARNQRENRCCLTLAFMFVTC
jgi:hypothetical protein